MSKWKIYTPEGVQDILFEECYKKRNIEQRIRDMFRASGYFEIESPTFEFYDAFSAEADLTPQETMFKFFDQQGRILVLRPDMTIPVARIAATKVREMNYPLRFSYIGNCFRYNELGGGKQKEFTQAGVEILGVNGPLADAEVIATAISAVCEAGIENFQIDIGQVDFFKGLMEETGLSVQVIEQMRILIDRKDFLGIEDIVATHKINGKLKELILELPGMFGSVDVIEKAEKMTTNQKSLKALQELRQVLEVLDAYGLGKYVSVDLGMVQSLNYYTGIIFRGFTYGAGFPILSGGRYDQVVEKFGKNCSATGFSLGINMVMMALERQKIEGQSPKIDSLVCCGAAGRKLAFQICTELRKQGLCVEMDVTGRKPEELSEYARERNIGGILEVVDEDKIAIHNLETGEVSNVSVDELCSRS